jgi:ribosome biogenesis GTPase A
MADEFKDCESESIPREALKLKAPRGFSEKTYIRKLRRYFRNLKKRVNIVVFGPYGAGKSAVITTWATALSNKKRILTGIAPSRNHNYHVTTSLNKIETDTMVTLLDCWGYSDENFKTAQVEKILDGIIKAGTGMHDTAVGKKGKGETSSEDEVVHGAVLVIDAQDFVGFGSVVDKLNELISLLLERGMTPIIALNKIDSVDPELEGRLGEVFSSNKVKGRIFAIHQETGLSINQIFPTKSYSDERSREEDVEKLALLCLKEVIQANVEDAEEEEGEGSDFEYDV